jgi:hypothetical protein
MLGSTPRTSRQVVEGYQYFESTFYCKDFSAANVVAESMMINVLHPMELTGLLTPILTDDSVVTAFSSWLGSIRKKVGCLLRLETIQKLLTTCSRQTVPGH